MEKPVRNLRLPNKRLAESFDFEVNGLEYTATINQFIGCALAEMFLINSKAGSCIDTVAKDSAVVFSIALQLGVPMDTIRRALMRDGRGRVASPLGVALNQSARPTP